MLAQRLRQVRSLLGYNQEQMGRILGVSREWVGRLEREEADFSEFLAWKLEMAEKMPAGDVSYLLKEEASSYGKSGTQDASTGRAAAPRSGSMLNPRFQPGEEPTPKACADYFAEYLKRAMAVPGGIGYVWVKLQKQFPLSEWEKETP